ncbi:TetR-like C-terminal domain-containing protein [Peribacillus sp. NPDC096379]|uniref:TetR-like C-terminal domain-containing protein n=1 Tax=Peribacillus sp. NPDC096379 TaxID=3364393 RepID=UPI00381D9A5A
MLRPSTNYNFREKLTKKLDSLYREEFDYSFTENDPNLDIHIFTTYLIYGMIDLILEWIENNFQQSSSYMGDQLIRIYKSNTPKLYVSNQG